MAEHDVSGHDRCPLDDLKFESSFFADEVREGFFVPTMMKRFWAAQMIVLSKIVQICERHDIKWVADYGTLIGAVRHGGYIPWDDDFDICMMRDDYYKFFEYAKDELPKEYVLLNMHTEEEYENVLGRVTNSRGIDYSEAHLKEYAGCPYSIGVDIFPLDNVSDDEELDNRRKEKVLLVAKAADMIDAGKEKSGELRNLLAQIEAQNNIKINRNGNIKKQLVLLTEKLYTEFSDEDTKYVASMKFWTAYNAQKHERAMFDDIVRLPFENTYINAPARYREMLKAQYGDFFKVYKGGGMHDYPAYHSQEEIFANTIGHNPFRFTLTPDMVTGPREVKPLSERFTDTITMLYEVHKQISVYMKNGNTTVARQLLEGCQNLAVSVGTLAESRLESCERCVSLLEEYCDIVFNVYSAWDDSSEDALNSKIDEVNAALGKLLASRKKKILILAFKAEWWPSIAPLYEKLAADPNNDVRVMSVPYCDDADYCDDKHGTRDDRELMPADLNVLSVNDYDIEKEHPDIIITQNPYDDQSTVFRTPEFFDSDNLLNYTDKLVYVPCFDVDDPGDDFKAVTSLNTLIEQPAVLYADEVILKSDELKTLYCKRLCEISGGHEDYWDSKIVVDEALCDPALENSNSPEGTTTRNARIPSEWKEIAGTRKLLLFTVDAAFLAENPEKGAGKIASAIDTISGASSDIVCVLAPGEDIEDLKTCEPDLWNAYDEIRRGLPSHENIIYDKKGLSHTCLGAFSGYYGTSGVLAHKCRNMGIPVMLINAEV